MTSISEAVGALLDLVQFRLGVGIEVLDTSLRPVRAGLQDPLFRAADEDSVRTLCLAVLKTGESRVERNGAGRLLAIYPLRLEREPIGLVLVAFSREAPGSGESGENLEELQTVALMARGMVENEVQKTSHLTRASERIRRLQGILRFIAHLRQLRTSADMMQAVVQAATVWFDLDCRIYHVAPGGHYELMSALPGLDPSEVPAELDGRRLRGLSAARHLSTLADLEFLTCETGRGGGMVVGAGHEDEVILVLIGSVDREVELTFSAIAQALGGALQFAARARHAQWRQRLAEHASTPHAVPERVLLALMRELCMGISAATARISVRWGDLHRTIAAVNLTDDAAREPRRSAGRSYRRTVPIGGGAELSVEVTGLAECDLEVHAAIEAWGAVVQPWILASPVLRDSEPTAMDAMMFERIVHQEVERARRFNLGLALVLIDPGEGGCRSPLGDVVRTVLRASDLYGPVRGGRMAAVLVHSGSEAALSVTRRIGQGIGTLPHDAATVRLGQAVFSSDCRSGDALIAEAIARLEPQGRDPGLAAGVPLQ